MNSYIRADISDCMGTLKKRIKKYDMYVIEIENEELEANNLKDVEDVIIISKEDFESELLKAKELTAKLESRDLELKLKEIKLQEKDLEIQKVNSEMHEFKEAYKSELVTLEKNYINKSNELKLLLDNKESKIEELKKEHCKLEEELEDKSSTLKNKLEEKETLQNQMEVYRIGNVGLRNEIRSKEEEIASLKGNYNNILSLKSQQEKEIAKLRSDIRKLEIVQLEHDKLINNYRHLQEVANKKDRNIIELEAQKRKLEQYLSMSLEAINTLKNLGLFNRLFNRVPEGIDELQEDIKKLQPPEEVEIEPVRVKKTSDIPGKK